MTASETFPTFYPAALNGATSQGQSFGMTVRTVSAKMVVGGLTAFEVILVGSGPSAFGGAPSGKQPFVPGCDKGGDIVAVGTPEAVAKCERSFTAGIFAGVVGVEIIYQRHPYYDVD